MINESIIKMQGFRTSLRPVVVVAFKIGNSMGFDINVVVGYMGLTCRSILQINGDEVVSTYGIAMH